jgi:predicted nucleotidyltransferase
MTEQNQLFEQVVALLRAEFGDDLLGVLATGSRVHSTPGPTSDLDVHVLIAQPRRQRRNIVLHGVEVELFINPPFQIRRYFGDRGVDEHMFTFGRAIYDPQGVVAELQAEARVRWQAGPPRVADAWMHRYAPADLLRDLEDVGAGDAATSNLLIARIVDMLLDSHYRLNRRWPAKPKRRLADLEGWDAHAAQLARAALACGPLDDRRAALDRLAAHALASIGGLMPLEWYNEWDAVQPNDERTEDRV